MLEIESWINLEIEETEWVLQLVKVQNQTDIKIL